VRMPANKNVQKMCQSHPDISLCRISRNELIYAKECDENFLTDLKNRGITLIKGNSGLNFKYPSDIKYNAAIIGNYLVHKLNNTDSKILEECEQRNIKTLNVKQGYTCCSTAIIGEKAAVTADKGIYNVLKKTGEVDVLLINPQKNIVLEGAEYGFIGGAGGRISDNEYVIAGAAEMLEDFEGINEFFQKHSVKLISLTQDMPVDLGGLIFFTM